MAYGLSIDRLAHRVGSVAVIWGNDLWTLIQSADGTPGWRA